MKIKSLIIFLPLITFVRCANANDDISFNDYKKLSTEKRQNMVDTASPEMHKRYVQWNQILSMGGQWWNSHQAEAFIRAKGFSGLENITNLQVNFWGNFHIETVKAKEKAGMSKLEAQHAADAISKYSTNDNQRYKDHWWYLVKLAPTSEALALDVKASALEVELDKKYGGSRRLSLDDLNAIDIQVKNIQEQMRKLPQLTPDQIEAGLAALPEEEVHR